MALPDFLAQKLRIPLIGAPMFIVSVPDLVVAQCTAGIVGSFPALNARPQESLVDWIRQVKEETAAHAEARIAFDVGPGAFRPRPKVVSSVVVLELRPPSISKA